MRLVALVAAGAIVAVSTSGVEAADFAYPPRPSGTPGRCASSGARRSGGPGRASPVQCGTGSARGSAAVTLWRSAASSPSGRRARAFPNTTCSMRACLALRE